MKTKVRGRNLNEVIAFRKARRLSRLRAVLFGAAVLAVIAWFIATRERRQLVRDIDDQRVVVLPLDNRTGDPSLDPLGIVVSDWTTRLLTFFHHSVSVVPTTTTLAYYRSANIVVHDLNHRAELLAIGVRARRVASGTFYQVGDSLRFDIYLSDIIEGGEARHIARVVVPLAQTMMGADRVAKRIALALLDIESLQRAALLAPSALAPYSAFVTGLDQYAQRNYRSSAGHFADALAKGGDAKRFQVWYADALVRDRQFARADSAIENVKHIPLSLGDADRAYMVSARIHGDWDAVYAGADGLVDDVPADDLAAFDEALAALALNRPRQARTMMLAQHPNRGALRSRPDFYLQLAAAHHLSGEHDRERRVARRGLFAHPRSVEVKLALCRAAAARRDRSEATTAIDRLSAMDAAPGATLTVAEALRDCAAELDFHELPEVARRAGAAAAVWERRRPTPPLLRDTLYERGYIAFDTARAAAARGDARLALGQLWFALESGLPYYEPGRMMLHAEPAFRRLRNTRGFIRITQPRG